MYAHAPKNGVVVLDRVDAFRIYDMIIATTMKSGLTSVVVCFCGLRDFLNFCFVFCRLRGFKRYEESNMFSDLGKSWHSMDFHFGRNSGEAYAAAYPPRPYRA